MAENQDRNVVKSDGGFFNDILVYMKLVVRLLMDSRVNPFLKLIPIGSLVYLLNPLDIPGPIDDAAIVGMGIFLFIELCPQDVVEEHKQAIRGVISNPSANANENASGFSEEDVIEAEYREE